MNRWLIVLIGALAIWVLAALNVLVFTLQWAPFIGVPLVGGIFWSLQSGPQKKKIRQALNKSWRIWFYSLLAATMLTIAIAFQVRIPFVNWGLPGTPWGYVYAMQLLVWCVVFLILGCCASKDVRGVIGRVLWYWNKRGGFWKLKSTDNMPANTIGAVWLLSALMVLLQWGPLVATPLAWLDDESHQAKIQVYQALHSEAAQEVLGKLDQMSQRTFSRSLPELPKSEDLVAPPAQRYHRNWFWPMVFVVLTPLAILAFPASRRDEFADLLERQANRIRLRDRTHGESRATRPASGPQPQESQSATQPTGQSEQQAQPEAQQQRTGGEQSYSQQLGQEIIAEGAIRFGERVLIVVMEWLSRTLRSSQRAVMR